MNVISRNPSESGGEREVAVENMDDTTSASISTAGDIVFEDDKSRTTVTLLEAALTFRDQSHVGRYLDQLRRMAK